MPRGVKGTKTIKEETSTKKVTSTKKKMSTVAKKTPTKITKNKEVFSFGSDAKPPVMDKDKRRKIIEEALCPKPTLIPIESWTVEDTEYIPKEWIVVVDTRYIEYDNFIAMMASIPDKPINTNGRFSFQTDCFYKTNFKVKGIDCQITTVSFDGSRSINNYSHLFGINNGTKNVGGNIVFSTLNKGMDKKSADKVVKEIIAIFEKGEEVDMKD